MKRLAASALAACFFAAGLAAPQAEATQSWNAENGRIAFTRCPSACDLYSMKPDGSGQKPFFEDSSFQDQAAWSPDGRHVAYRQSEDIWVMRSDGSHRRNLTSTARSESSPSWSPDGDTLVFSATTPDDTKLYTMDSADGRHERAVKHTASLSPFAPAFSPSGKLIAFGATTGSTADIWIIGSNGHHPRPVFEGDQNEGYPAWSPDGKHLAISRNQDIAVVTVKSGHVSPVLVPEATALTPAWSPNGEKLAYYCFDSGGGGDICTIKPDSSHHDNLTNDAVADFFFD